MTVWTFVLVSLAGGGGAAGRFVADALIRSRVRGHFPIATVLVNLTGSFALGLLAGSASGAHSTTLAILGTGLLGGFTTFSASAVETTRLALAGRAGWSLLNVAGTLIGCMALAWAGLLLTG
jgi:fluoride exporter